ncbi:hypothetical protein [Streptomyces albospinus]|uniref:hypothetical protein n=1 Tax=Streptomyces albospinus TaxID=285515 RepID=UPI0016717D10|nr:hypothetical protein [Streptomyces albospinus]
METILYDRADGADRAPRRRSRGPGAWAGEPAGGGEQAERVRKLVDKGKLVAIDLDS